MFEPLPLHSSLHSSTRQLQQDHINTSECRLYKDALSRSNVEANMGKDDSSSPPDQLDPSLHPIRYVVLACIIDSSTLTGVRFPLDQSDRSRPPSRTVIHGFCSGHDGGELVAIFQRAFSEPIVSPGCSPPLKLKVEVDRIRSSSPGPSPSTVVRDTIKSAVSICRYHRSTTAAGTTRMHYFLVCKQELQFLLLLFFLSVFLSFL